VVDFYHYWFVGSDFRDPMEELAHTGGMATGCSLRGLAAQPVPIPPGGIKGKSWLGLLSYSEDHYRVKSGEWI